MENPKKEKQVIRKILAWMLSFAMILGMLPMDQVAVAAEEGNGTAITEAGVSTEIAMEYKGEVPIRLVETNCEELELENSYVGYYAIANKDQLQWFAGLVDGREDVLSGSAVEQDKSANAVLIADIDMEEITWTPITQTISYHADATDPEDKGYAGVFDGNGHVISNFNITGISSVGSEIYSYGLFGTLSGTIKKLGISDCTYNMGTAGDCRAAAIAGQVLAGGLITDCYVVNSSIKTNNNIAGGVVGCNYGGSVKNCYTYGCKVTGYGTRTANIVGDCKDDAGKNSGTINNCYTNASKAVSTQCDSDKVTDCIGSVSESDFQSGKITWLLNGSVMTVTNVVWKQTCGTGLPAFSGKEVFAGYKGCSPNYKFDNDKKNLIDAPEMHCYEKGFCTELEGEVHYETPKMKDGVYLIENAGQLYWFAGLVNNDPNVCTNGVTANRFANAKLMKDLVVNTKLINEQKTSYVSDNLKMRWTPIGTGNSSYAGVFDGNYHTISGLFCDEPSKTCIGLFGYIKDTKIGVVKNLTVTDSYFRGYCYVGGITGAVENGTLENCTFDGIVQSVYYLQGTAGGIVGRTSISNLTRCVNKATVSGYSEIGGIAGNCISTLIKKCYNLGDVSCYDMKSGGIIGGFYDSTNASDAFVKDCYNAGRISGPYFVGNIVGYSRHNYERDYNYANNYYIEGLAFDGNNVPQYGMGGTAKGMSRSDTAGSFQQKTKEAFASGEVAWLLNGGQTENGFTQVLSGEGVSVEEREAYPVFGSKVVYRDETRFCPNAQPEYSNVYSNDKNIVKIINPDHVYEPVAGPDGVEYRCIECNQLGEHQCKYVNGICSREGCLHPYEQPEGNGSKESPYQITTPGELQWYIGLCNGDDSVCKDGIKGNKEANAVLCNDIVIQENVRTRLAEGELDNAVAWESINELEGTFDGKGYSISGIYSTDGAGLCHTLTEDGCIRNVVVTDAAVRGTEDAISTIGGIVGINAGLMENCTFFGQIGTEFLKCNSVGGICVINDGRISRCNVVDAKLFVTTDMESPFVYINRGVIDRCQVLGWRNVDELTISVLCYQNYSAISNCYVSCQGDYEEKLYLIGTNNEDGSMEYCYVNFNNSVSGNISYIVNHNLGTVKNVYAVGVDQREHRSWIELDSGATSQVESITDEEAGSGALAYRLNKDQEESVFGQILDGKEESIQKYPVLDGETVYALRTATCPGVEPVIKGYSNVNQDTSYGEHVYEDGSCISCGRVNHNCTYEYNGFCGICGKLATPKGDGSKECPYEIGTLGELYWFAKCVNGTKAMDYSDANSNACAILAEDICMDITALQSTGISVNSWSMIGSTKVYKGTFDGAGHRIYETDGSWNTMEDEDSLFATIGNGGIVRNLFVELQVATADAKKAAGICLDNQGQITDCVVKGKLDTEKAAGICYTNNGVIENCYTDVEMDGFYPVVCEQFKTISNCYYMDDADRYIPAQDGYGSMKVTREQEIDGTLAWWLNTSRGEISNRKKWGQDVNQGALIGTPMPLREVYTVYRVYQEYTDGSNQYYFVNNKMNLVELFANREGKVWVYYGDQGTHKDGEIWSVVTKDSDSGTVVITEDMRIREMVVQIQLDIEKETNLNFTENQSITPLAVSGYVVNPELVYGISKCVLKNGSTLPEGLTMSSDGIISGKVTEVCDNKKVVIVITAGNGTTVELTLIFTVKEDVVVSPEPGSSESPAPGGSESPAPGGSENPEPGSSEDVNPVPGESESPAPGGSENPEPGQSEDVNPNPSQSEDVNPEPGQSEDVNQNPEPGQSDKPNTPITPPEESGKPITPPDVSGGTTVTTPPAVSEEAVLGDIDGEGGIALRDAQLALRAALLLDKLDEKQQKAADVDENGAVELRDAQQILRRALLLIEEFEKAKK